MTTMNVASVDTQPKFVLEGDSNILLGLVCVPLVGLFVSKIYEGPLEVLAEKEKDVPRLIEIINLKNNYKFASIVQIVVCFAFSFFTNFFPVLINFCCVFLYTVITLESIEKNKKLVAELQTSGYRSEIGSEVR